MVRPARRGRPLLVAALILLATTGHVVYPVALHLKTRRVSDRRPPQPSIWPALTVVVPAYREDVVIAAKVADLRANGYQGLLEVVVVADDEATARAAKQAGAVVSSSGKRLGKAMALNAGVDLASGEIVVITDANTSLAPGSLAAMARWFSDGSVTAVAGEKTVDSGGEGTYWRFESWIKAREARTGSTIGLVGELAAVRRDGYRALPGDLVVEDLWLALDILEHGGSIVYEPAARAIEAATPGWRAEWERRTRVVCGTLDVLWRRRELLAPGQGLVAAQLWGHRLVRSSIGPLAHVGLLGLALLAARRRRVARVALCGQALAVVAALRTQGRASQGALERLAGQATFLQAVALGGMVRYVRHDRPALWPKPARQPATAPE